MSRLRRGRAKPRRRDGAKKITSFFAPLRLCGEFFMSRFVTMQTRLRDREVLQQCLELMGFQVLYEARGIKLRGTRKPVQLLVHAPFGTLGFRETAAHEYELVADETSLVGRQDLLKRLTQQYAYRKILKDAAAAGYHLVQEEVGADQTIKLVVRKW